MKLFVVTLPETKTYVEIRDVAKKVDPNGMVTVVDEGRSFEFQNKLMAEEVISVFGGEMKVIEYDVKTIYK